MSVLSWFKVGKENNKSEAGVAQRLRNGLPHNDLGFEILDGDGVKT